MGKAIECAYISLWIGAEAATAAIDMRTLHAKTGELMLVKDFLSGALGPGRNRAGLLLTAER